MRVTRISVLAAVVSLTCLAVPGLAQVEVTVEELDVGGDPPGLEGMPGVFLRNQDTGADHLVVFGGCTEDSMWDQALVLSDVSGGFDDLTWTTVPVPGMGAACEHIVAGPGDVAYLIGGYHNDFTTMRPMNEILEIRLAGSAVNPMIEATEFMVDCEECPEARVGHAATWLDSFEDCDTGGILIGGGMNDTWEMLDDAWFFCPEDSAKNTLDFLSWRRFDPLNLPEAMGDFVILYHPYEIGSGTINKIYLVGHEPGRGLTVYRLTPIGGENHWKPIHSVPLVEARWGFGAVTFRDGIAITAGATLDDGQIVKENLTLNLRTFEWTYHQVSPVGLANILCLGQPGGEKRTTATMGFIFGGVEDFSPPRVVSNSTYLMTTTVPDPQAHYAVPAVARVRGAGAFFTSVMHLHNAGGSDLELEMTFTPRSGSGGEVTTVSHTVPAGVMQTIEDPLDALFGFGGSAGRVGSLLVTATSGSAADLMLQTVVFAQLDSGEEYGQFFPAMRGSDAIPAGQTVYLNTTEDPGHNRVNIGLMALTDGTRLRVTPVGFLGSGLAAPRTYDLDMGGNTQINNLHTTFGLGSTANVVVEVEVVTGSGLAYASVLDGSGAYAGTSDPTTILPVLRGSEQVTLLEIGSIQGLNEFSGSACITNYSEQAAAVRAHFFQRDVAGVTATENLTIAAGETMGFTDLGSDLFGVSGDVGTVVLTTTNETLVGATGREFAIFRDNQGDVVGTAGQLIAGQTDGDRLAAGTTYHFIGLRQERGGGPVERSHFAAYNPGWGDSQVTVRLYDGASGNLEGERSWIVAGRTLIQVNNVIRAINPDFDDGEKRIEIEVDQPVFMNAFRVNKWGDPVTLSPFPG